ncbi:MULTISPECIES: FGGY family carbohydrate kinase [unclassified Paenibacillus]|uniref:FGGY-family carbohydrate kinase n=1 Tax=unclassified Paenibacillus TaxID=185978 RepID=UPI001AEB6697|nr:MULTISPECIES: FGGY family carbohydrate kinase [unclassified Paenibacillus]MBP1154129.1 sugar (pentulose or hexulose) kinase [Paenibacillus sp. PvP091]MBP1170486.1 sugar (pentulose or hexulose) kinase [Paenibacillus sp. PvR098]MBP2441514.1 sugar (pentulose or hexulose) kinase [Paenibacillus sp. PvP052]
MNCIVTLDVGTTHIKGYLFSASGEKLNHVIHPTSFLRLGNGISEIDPDQVLNDISYILKSVVHASPEGVKVDAIVVSGMACSFIPVNRQGRPLYPCICWNDQRTATGINIPDIDPIVHHIQQYPLPMYLPYRMKWFSENNPAILSDAYKWLNLTDYIVHHLSSDKDYITDYSQASRTMLFNSLTKQWNSPAADHFNVPLEKLPTPEPAGTVIGTLDADYQLHSGYRNTQLILGGHDHMFAALAGGIHNSSIALNSTGTSEALVLPYLNDPSFSFVNEECNLESHVIDNEFFVVGYVASTGRIMEWADRLFDLFKWEQQLDLVKVQERIKGLPLYVPSGRRMQPSRTGRFINLQPSHDGQDFALSVMEGLCFETRALLGHLNTKLNIQTDLLRLVGGSSKSKNFLQMKSSILQKPIEVIHDVDMTSLGGYILSGLALHYFRDVKQTAKEVLEQQKKTLLEPDKAMSHLFESRYHRYVQERRA